MTGDSLPENRDDEPYRSPLAPSGEPLRAWCVLAEKSRWSNFADVRAQAGPTASAVGNCVIFNIRGNHYRLVVRIVYPKPRVYILKVMTHAEYSENKWPEECGCFQGPPGQSLPTTRGRPREAKRSGR